MQKAKALEPSLAQHKRESNQSGGHEEPGAPSDAEHALHASELRFRILFECSPVGIALIREGIVLQANQAYLRLFGYASSEEALGLPITAHLAPAWRERIQENVRKREQGLLGPVEHLELEGLRPDGSTFPYSVAVARIDLPDGPALVAFYRDLTEQRRAEHQRLLQERWLQEAQRVESLRTLAAGIAHDFNNLLTVILNNAELLGEDLDTADPAYSSVEALIAASSQALRLNRQLMAYTGRGERDVRSLDMSALVRLMSRLLHASVPAHIRLIYRLDDTLPPLIADSVQIQQVVLNLVINAAEAIGERPGSITVETGTTLIDEQVIAAAAVAKALRPGPCIYLQIADSGRGMSRETVDRLFEPFYTTKQAGRGLGLATVLSIVRSHQSGVLVSSAPGIGTTFRILFPINLAQS